MNSKNSYPTARLAMALLLPAFITACDVHEWPAEEEQPSVVDSRVKLVYRDVEMPVYTTIDWSSPSDRSRAADTDVDSRHIIKVYADNSIDGIPYGPLRHEVASVTLTDDDDENIAADRRVDIPLPPGRYTYVAWTDYGSSNTGEDLYYTTSDFSEITLRSKEEDGLYYHAANTLYRDAFRGEGSFRIGSDGVMYDSDGKALREAVIEMRRPLASFVFVSTDLADFISDNVIDPAAKEAHPGGEPRSMSAATLADYRIVFRYTGYMPYVFNAVTDKPVDSQTGAAFESEIMRTEQPGEAFLGSDFVFVNDRESSVLVGVDVYDRTTGRRVSSTDAITVPIVRNKITIVRGRFLTSKVGSDIGVDPGFSGDINIEIK